MEPLRHGLRGEATQIVPPAPRYAPQMREALADAGLYKRSGTAPPAENDAAQSSFSDDSRPTCEKCRDSKAATLRPPKAALTD